MEVSKGLIEGKLGLELREVRYFDDEVECWQAVGAEYHGRTGEVWFPDRVKGQRMAKHHVRKMVFGLSHGQVWRVCCNPRCLNPCHFDIARRGETTLMGKDGRKYWRRRKFFVGKGYVPGKAKGGRRDTEGSNRVDGLAELETGYQRNMQED